MKDWRQAIQLPTAYRIGNSTVRLQYQFVVGVIIVGVIALVMFYNTSHSRSLTERRFPLENRIPKNIYNQDVSLPFQRMYNSTYPLTTPVRTEKGIRYRIGIIADLDQASRKGDDWVSYLKTGFLFVDSERSKVCSVSQSLVCAASHFTLDFPGFC